MTFLDKKIVITGGSSGLGLAVSQKLIQLGAKVLAVGISQKASIEAKKTISSEKFQTVIADISRPEEISKILEKIPDPDILINNAGVFQRGDLQDLEIAKIRQVVEVNLLGQILITQAYLPYFLEKNSGIIYNVISTAGLNGKAKTSVYCASKFGFAGFSQSLALELSGTGIKVLDFFPGGMQTNLFANSGDSRDTTNFMKVEDIADLITFTIQNSDKYLLSKVVANRIS